MALFEASTIPTRKQLPLLIPRCGSCGLFRGCKSPKMPISGEGRKGILVIAEAPGEDEDNQNTQLIGRAGQYLRSVLSRFDVDLDRDCWKTNALICRPPENRTPSVDEIDDCRPNLIKALRDLQPRHVIPLGAAATRSLLGHIWKEDPGAFGQWVGWRIPLQQGNFWVTPTYHPSHVKRSEDEKIGPVVKLWFEKHLEDAINNCHGRPWETVPDYESEIQIVTDPEVAARRIRWMIDQGKAVAFDYETDRLKPDPPDSEIVSCAVCWNGERTIAYPWVGEAIIATSELLQSELPKLGANKKFEERWSRAKLGHGVVNWKWDVCLSGHHLDNRRNITGVKFQSFVRLGFPPWNSHIEPYLEAPTAITKNRIREIDLRSLLLYNGIDSLVEFKISTKQRIEMLTG